MTMATEHHVSASMCRPLAPPGRTVTIVRSHLAAAGLLLTIAGCGSSAPADKAQPPSPPGAPASITLDASQVAAALKARGVPLTVVKVYTADDDPNHQLGRPGGYTSKVAFSDARSKPNQGAAQDAMERGGSVEVFTSQDEAIKRGDYIQTVTRAAPIVGLEYDYVAGPVVLRVTGGLTPTIAGTYAAALHQATGAPLVTPSPLHT
jgi:hypothetical protein